MLSARLRVRRECGHCRKIFAQICIARFGGTLVIADSIVKQPTLRRPVCAGRREPLVLFSAPRKTRGAERRQALVRKRRTPDRPRGQVHLRKFGRRSPAIDAGRRAFRRSAAAFSLRRRAALSGICADQPAPGGGSLCPQAEPRRRPSACCACSTPAGAAPVRGPELPGAGCRKTRPHLKPRLSGLLRHQDASRWRPSASRCAQCKGGFGERA
jgi:hypothetical protein